MSAAQRAAKHILTKQFAKPVVVNPFIPSAATTQWIKNVPAPNVQPKPFPISDAALKAVQAKKDLKDLTLSEILVAYVNKADISKPDTFTAFRTMLSAELLRRSKELKELRLKSKEDHITATAREQYKYIDQGKEFPEVVSTPYTEALETPHPFLELVECADILHDLQSGNVGFHGAERKAFRALIADFVKHEGKKLADDAVVGMEATELYDLKTGLYRLSGLLGPKNYAAFTDSLAAVEAAKKAERTLRHDGRKAGDTQYYEAPPY